MLNKPLIEYELSVAAYRQQIDLTYHKFEMANVHTFDASRSTAHLDGNGAKELVEVTAHDVGVQMFMDASAEVGSMLVLLSIILGAVHSTLPLIVRAIMMQPVMGGETQTSWNGIAFSVSLWIVNTFTMFSNFAYVAVPLFVALGGAAY